jgi:transposase
MLMERAMSRVDGVEPQQPELFGELPAGARQGKTRAVTTRANARVMRPNRAQMEMRASDLEALIAADHEVRLVWGFVERADLSRVYERIRAAGEVAGRPAIAPEIMLCLWLYGTLQAVGSARALARLTESHDAYRWICGGVTVNYHALADFRVEHGAWLDELLARQVATLSEIGAVQWARLAQDGMRVRASAGAASFRRKPTLEKLLDKARQHVKRLRTELEADPTVQTRRDAASAERAAREREARLERALAMMPELERTKRRNGDDAETARASTSDAHARVMRMADGGYRPAYNVQMATDTASQVVVGVQVIGVGTDAGQLAPMLGQLERVHGRLPRAVLADGGFVALGDVQSLEERGVAVLMPPPEPRRPKDGAPEAVLRSRYARLPEDTEQIARWRRRMGRAAIAEIYKERAASAECVNAQARQRGLTRFTVRGLERVRPAALWYALAHNLKRAISLGVLGEMLQHMHPKAA